MDKSVLNKMTILGVMSGTSLDGLDLAVCEFEQQSGLYKYNILKAKTIAYDKTWKGALENACTLGAEKYFRLHHNYGKYIAEEINKFIGEHNLSPDAIASHGHTIFHQPNLGFTTQIGCGATIAALTKTTTVCDFRSLDVANGGEGAPLVPVGDQLLFGDYDSCLNIGGIANISYKTNNTYKAFDICFANMALNYLAEKLGKAYDENGDLARSGKPDEKLLSELTGAFKNENNYSLSREVFEKTTVAVLNNPKLSIEDQLTTFCVYAGNEIANVLTEHHLKNVLITGGGAYNAYLINCIRNNFKGEVVIPPDEIIQFKEALIFAFLGYLRLNTKINTLSSVTGAATDSSGGAVYLFNKI